MVTEVINLFAAESGTFISMIYDLILNFEGFVSFYFTGPLVLSALTISVLISYLRRSNKPAILAYCTIMGCYCLAALCEATGAIWTVPRWMRHLHLS